MSGTGGGGGIIIHAQTKPHDHHHFTKEDLAAIIAALPDGDLKTRLQAIYDSLS